VLPLDRALYKISNIKLAKELAYCLCTDAKDRMKHDRYYITFNTIPLKDWSCIAVIQLSLYIKSFRDIAVVDFSYYRNKKFQESNPKFLNLVLYELNQLRKI